MKTRQAVKKYGYSLIEKGRGLVLTAATLASLCVPAGVAMAALEAGENLIKPLALGQWTLAQAPTPPTTSAGDAIVPPVRREKPQAPSQAPAEVAPAQPAPVVPAAAPHSTAKPEQKTERPQQSDAKIETPEALEATGFLGTIQEWLARANREYQGVVVKELSLPHGVSPPDKAAEDEIAKKLTEQQAEEAKTAVDAKRAEEAAQKQSQEKAKAAARTLEAKKLDEDRKKAEETKLLADEAKKKADELFKTEAEKKPEPKPEAMPATKPEVATPAAPATPMPDAAAEAAEQQRLEAQRQAAEEAKRQEQLKQEQVRKAEDERRLENQRKKAEAAAKAEDDRRRAAEVTAANKDRSRAVVITPEPIARPKGPGTSFRPEMSTAKAKNAREERFAEKDSNGEAARPIVQHRRIRIFSEPTYRGIRLAAYRGTAVKRWVWRANGHECRLAGRHVTPPARYTIQRGDSLWRISERHYNEGRLYPKIYRANRDSISDPDLIYPCQRVLVPRR